MKRQHFEYYGDVQGVGFRWTVMKAAEAAGATGWVRNEYDGSVSAELQGNQEQIDYVNNILEQDQWIRITRKTVTDIPLVKTERSFTIQP